MRCQQYGHSRTYCNKPYVCVKCGGSHNTAACKTNKETSAGCALCDGAHLANYKGCEFYQKLFKLNNRRNIQHIANTASNSSTHPMRRPHIQQLQQHPRTYAQVTNNSRNQQSNINDTMNKFQE